jgi:ABC-2 type transport system ATP-binding protein
VSTPALHLRGLVKRYGGRPVVDALDLTAASGAVTAVLGPNGAGKTTTLEICEGLRTADAGSVEVLGLPPRDPDLRPRVGVMLQEGGVYGSVTAREALRHASALYACSHPVDDLLAVLGLADAAGTPARRLSGGQRQRLGVALALVGRPELVFLDEPTAGLDPQSRLAVWDLVRTLRAAGVAVVLTTHYLDEAEQLADHVVIIDSGRSIAAGRPDELVAQRVGEAVRFTATPGLDLAGLRQDLPADATVTEPEPGRYVVAAPTAAAVLPLLTRWFTTVGAEPSSISTERQTLEDVFLALTGEELRP